MTKGKAEKIDLSHLSFEEAVRKAWEAEPPPKDGKTPADQAEDEEKRRIKTGEENTG